MDSAGSPFNSEIWAKDQEVIDNFKQGKDSRFYTSIVVATADRATAEQFARDLQSRTQVRINAMPERTYYENLSQSNKAFFITALIIAIMMAVGGTFGLLNTMFAAVSQRIKDIGVLRVLGYSRGQILVSFLLESLLIALIGGALGVMIGYLANGVEQTGQMSSGQGGGKTVVFKMVVDYTVVMWGLAFTLGMGLLGGLLPAWSAMRLKVLDALR
jgi:ABC-type antimicrobial peptide transport system permease subunit